MPEIIASTLASQLAEAAGETFERLGYLLAEPGVADHVPADAVDGIVAVAFSGPAHGGVILQLSGGILAELAGNMLGLDETVAGGDQQDALGETANVICGNVLPRIVGPAAVFALGVPQPYRSWDDAVDVLGSVTARVRLDVEGGRADVGLVMLPAH
ncbi:MAG: chemotaxis protein CheX [Gemmatimonadaceae bacterium]|nr:chemotaxis protein CheX [Gemmatimonadaceae bacterium]